MKKYVAVLLAVLIIGAPLRAPAAVDAAGETALPSDTTAQTEAEATAPTEAEAVLTSARAAVVIDMSSGRVLYEQNAHERLAMASTTKIMSTLLALEEPEIDSYFAVSEKAIRVEGSSMGLIAGDKVSLRQLCYGMILPSGNDAANVVAEKLGGDNPGFAALMNERAYQLGLFDTAFVTPSGLDAPGHYTTALDLARLSMYAMGSEDFREICGQYSAKTKFGNPPYERWLRNYNKLLDMYEPCIGIKTGFTDDAGRVLVSAAERDGIELLCVTMNDPDDWRDHENLYEKLFSELSMTDIRPLLPEVIIPVAGGKNEIRASARGNTHLPLREGEYERISIAAAARPFLYAPVARDDVCGQVRVLLSDETIMTLPLCAGDESAPVHPYGEKKGIASLIEQLFN